MITLAIELWLNINYNSAWNWYGTEILLALSYAAFRVSIYKDNVSWIKESHKHRLKTYDCHKTSAQERQGHFTNHCPASWLLHSTLALFQTVHLQKFWTKQLVFLHKEYTSTFRRTTLPFARKGMLLFLFPLFFPGEEMQIHTKWSSEALNKRNKNKNHKQAESKLCSWISCDICKYQIQSDKQWEPGLVRDC